MAGISQKVSLEEVLPLLARNVAVEGYQGRKDRTGRPTEFLILLKRYVEQARQLVTLAGPEGTIRVSSCDQAGPLLDVLGYRVREGCGKSVALETADPERAFLTIDSGFPLAELEQTLQGGKPFACHFTIAQVPMLFSAADWTQGGGDVLDAMLDDPMLARLYWAVSRMDTETSANLRQFTGMSNLLPFAAVLDFYSSHISIRNGRMVVPGGAAAEPAWKELAGASPDSPKEFVARLLAKDDGWLAAYFDTLSRLTPAQQVYFTDARRLPRFYEALKGKDIAPGPARPVFRPDPDLLILVTRLQLDPSGQATVPGNLEVWDQILRQKTDSKLVHQWAKHSSHWKDTDQLVEALFAFSRQSSDDGPLRIYLMLSAIDSARPAGQRMSPETVRLLAQKFSRYGNQYLIFSEFQGLERRVHHPFSRDGRCHRPDFQCHVAGQRPGYFPVQRGSLGNPGAPGTDSRGEFECILAGRDRSFCQGHRFFCATVRLGSDLGARAVAGRAGAGRIFPRTKWSPCWPARASRNPTVKKSGRNWRTECMPSWTVSAWYPSTLC